MKGTFMATIKLYRDENIMTEGLQITRE